jgi:LmbE family N-acetylglucosaminyl deacetylase
LRISTPKAIKEVMQAERASSMLVIGHPGHEIRCHAWLNRHRPTVVVMTSGGGASKPGRIASTLRVIERAGATASPLFGNFSDHEVYGFMLRQEAGKLGAWTRQLSELIRQERPAVILTDMVEGYNSSHDLTAYLVASAVEMTHGSQITPPLVLCQPLDGRPDQAWNGRLRPHTTLALTDAEFRRKMEDARTYAELAAEVADTLRQTPAEAFRQECLYLPAEADALLESLPGEVPFYETFGEQQVAQGKFAEVIRHKRHLVPLVRTIRHDLGLPAR